MSRGIIYILWEGKKGEQPRANDRLTKALNRSVESADKFGIPHKVYRADSRSYSSKIEMFKKSPFDTTLFLDVDTILLRDPTFGFEAAEKYAIPHWNLDLKNIPKLVPEYNVGVVFFDKSKFTNRFSGSWNKWANMVSKQNPICDQNSFSIAAWEEGPIFTLPLNWNWRPSYEDNQVYGPINIWHSYDEVPKWIISQNNGRFKFRKKL
jgi:hypothetical protein